jgi:hypothetical protein
MKIKLKYIVITITFAVISINYCNAQNADSIKGNSKPSLCFEALGMRSIVFQKQPYPYIPPDASSTGSRLAGYIPKPSYSIQFSLLETIKLYKSLYIKGGLQLKLMNSKYEKKENWQPPFKGNPAFIYGKSNVLTFTNYIMYKSGSNYFGFGLSIFAINMAQIDFCPKSIYKDFLLNKRYSALLLRYEKNIKKILKSKANLIVELESSNKTWDYFQVKIGFNYNIF